MAEDLVESHHVKFKAKGGKDEYKNLVIMHNHCHDQYHAQEVTRLSKGGKFKGESEKIPESFYKPKSKRDLIKSLQDKVDKAGKEKTFITSKGFITLSTSN
jgi:hypothetical protein